MLPRDIDTITFEGINTGLDSLVDEMALTIMRTAYSGIVKDAMDYSTGFCDRDGRTIAQGLSIVLHLGSFPAAVASIIDKYKDSIYPGDVFILNDPYTAGGIHLPDIYVIRPVFESDRLEGFACTLAHHTDVGGIVPGSNSTNATEIFQEGIRIPALKLYEKGVANETLFEMIATNVRLPRNVLGDIRAEVAATIIGEREYLRLVKNYGADEMRRHTDALIEYSEKLARDEISNMPDGKYEFASYIDGDNIDTGPVKIQVKLVVESDEIVVDFSGSSPQVKAGINSPLPFTQSATYGSIRQLMDPSIPNTVGFSRPIHVIAPEASVVNASLPAACGARGITGFRAMDALFGALAQIAPDRIPADGEGGNTIVSIGGYDSSSEPFAFIDLFAGGRGARPTCDGPEGLTHPGSNNSNTPVELAEVETPVRIEQYGLIIDTGGAGQFRGSLSQVREVRCLAEEGVLQLRSDKRRFRPYGLNGGEEGNPSLNILNPETDDITLPAMGVATMKKDDVIRHVMAGGGGWGNPYDRVPEMVLDDVWNEKLSVSQARTQYGVVINHQTLELDLSATEKLRSDLR